MITQEMIRQMIRASEQDKPCYPSIKEACRFAIIGGMSEGQKIFSICSRKMKIKTKTFVGFLRVEREGRRFSYAVVEESGRQRVENYFVRDLMLSVGGEYPTECFYLCESAANLALRRLKKQKAQQLLEGENNGSR